MLMFAAPMTVQRNTAAPIGADGRPTYTWANVTINGQLHATEPDTIERLGFDKGKNVRDVLCYEPLYVERDGLHADRLLIAEGKPTDGTYNVVEVTDRSTFGLLVHYCATVVRVDPLERDA